MKKEKLWTGNFIIGTCFNLSLMVNYYLMMVVITEYTMKTFSVSNSTAGLCSSIFIIGALFSRLASGVLMEKIGRKKLLYIGAAIELLMSIAYFFALNLPVLFCIRIIHGLSYGVCSVAIGTIVTSIVPDSRQGEGVGYYMLSSTLGSAVGPFLAMFLTSQGSYVPVFVTCIAAASICFLGAFLVKSGEEPRIKISAGDIKKRSTEEYKGIKKFLETRAIPISLLCALVYFCYSSLLTFVKPYTNEVNLAKPAEFFFVVYSASMFVTRPLTGKLYDKKGELSTMPAAYIGFALGMLVLSFAKNIFMLYLAAALLGFGLGVVQSGGLAAAIQSAPKNRIGMVNSTFWLICDLGVGLGPYVLGIFVPQLGYAGMYRMLCYVTLAGLVLYLIVRIPYLIKRNHQQNNNLLK